MLAIMTGNLRTFLAFVQLELFEEALQDAEKGRALATARLKVTRKSIPGYVKTYLRKGAALNGMPS